MAPGSSNKSEHGGKQLPWENSLYKPPDVTLIERPQWDHLSKRYRLSPKEVQVASLVCRGLKNTEIAGELKIKRGTVRTHLKSIFIKTRTKSKITLFLQLVGDAHTLFASPPAQAHIPIVDYYRPTGKGAVQRKIPQKDEHH
jgi:DNA-binding CsgD family transcriptional regulator